MSRKGPLRRAWKRCRESLLDRAGCLYTSRFYRKSDRKKGDSDRHVAETLLARYAPRRVVDLGCGSGYFLSGFARSGVAVFGLEHSRAGCALTRAAGLPVARFDLRHDPLPAEAQGELCLCFEVAEHVAAGSADRLVDLVTAIAPRVAFTAAPPGQGGVGHVNEQPPEYWIERFAARGQVWLAADTAALREEWRARGVVSWLVTNLLIFERQAE